jgi:hypothetical protein
VATYVCKNDRAHTCTEDIAATGKHNLVTIPAIPATCEETGLSEGSKCADCGKIVEEQTVTPKLGHDYICTAIVDATCTEDGAKHYVCQYDNNHIYTEPIPATGHNYVDGVCANCGENDKNVPDTGDMIALACVLSAASGMTIIALPKKKEN